MDKQILFKRDSIPQVKHADSALLLSPCSLTPTVLISIIQSYSRQNLFVHNRPQRNCPHTPSSLKKKPMVKLCLPQYSWLIRSGYSVSFTQWPSHSCEAATLPCFHRFCVKHLIFRKILRRSSSPFGKFLARDLKFEKYQHHGTIHRSVPLPRAIISMIEKPLTDLEKQPGYMYIFFMQGTLPNYV